MTRVPYDQAAKTLLDGALEGAGRIEAQRELSSEPQWIDVWFEPDPDGRPPAGLLGRMVRKACAFEIFHDPPKVDQVIACVGKQIAMHQRLRRASRQNRMQTVPTLWIVCAARSTTTLRAFAMKPLANWPAGIYRSTLPALPLFAVVVAELPRERETLLFRLMGAGQVLGSALDELSSLSPHAWERTAAAGAIDVLRSAKVFGADPLDPEEEANIVKASQVYERIKNEGRTEGVLEGRTEGLLEGRTEGLLEGERRILVRQLELRFGALADDVRARIQAATAEQLERWAERLLSAQDLDDALRD